MAALFCLINENAKPTSLPASNLFLTVNSADIFDDTAREHSNPVIKINQFKAVLGYRYL